MSDRTKEGGAVLWHFKNMTLWLVAMPAARRRQYLGPDPMPELKIDDASAEVATRAAVAWADSEIGSESESQRPIALLAINLALNSYELPLQAVTCALESFRLWYLDNRSCLRRWRRIAVLKQMRSRLWGKGPDQSSIQRRVRDRPPTSSTDDGGPTHTLRSRR